MIRVTCYDPIGDVVIPNGENIELEVDSNDDTQRILILDKDNYYIAFFDALQIKACYKVNN